MKPAADPDTDTQWPRYEVFQQSRPDAPYSNVGSVHAPDAEIALQNARDVFVRRPQTHRLWVVPAAAIFSRTLEQLENEGLPASSTEPGAPKYRYHIFRKTSQRRAMTYVVQCHEVEATSPAGALRLALEHFAGEASAFVWWVVPQAAILASQDEDIESMFLPAHDKTYRMPTEYRTQTMMRELEDRDDSA